MAERQPGGDATVISPEVRAQTIRSFHIRRKGRLSSPGTRERKKESIAINTAAFKTYALQVLLAVNSV